jgi:hypothetical protein
MAVISARKSGNVGLGAAVRRFHLFACALSTIVAMAAPTRADDNKVLRFVRTPI